MAVIAKEDRAQVADEQIRFTDSIVALSSGRLPAGVAVLRLSGPHARFVSEIIAGELPSARMATFRTLRAMNGEPIDNGLALFFPGPRSFTGEDVVEFHVHGGRASVAALLKQITAFDGVRHAEPGEFTRRAFLNGKLDLTETEALADLIEAETEAQRRLAMRNASGAQSALYLGWRRRLIHARAMIEADIDFSDEEDVPGSVADTIWSDVRTLVGEMERYVAGFHAAEIIREGYDVVILGAPNAGKSSLFNALARRDAAIVTDEPGTTRDLLEVALDVRGIKVRITDTAGLRRGGGKVENIGIERARVRAREADLVLVLEDLAAPRAAVELDAVGAPVLRLGSKVDLRKSSQADGYDLVVSSLTGEGIDVLLDEIGRRAIAQLDIAGGVLPSRARHVELLGEARSHLERALAGNDVELRAEDLRIGAERLGRIVGAVDVEDLLDVIFSQFCIGK